jgi:hypothetical protein
MLVLIEEYVAEKRKGWLDSYGRRVGQVREVIMGLDMLRAVCG